MKIMKDSLMINYQLKNSANGVQSKYYNEYDNYWYKEDYLGTEGLSEYVSTLLLQGSGISHAKYTPCQFKNGLKTVIGCKSINFLSKEEDLVSAYELIMNYKQIDITKAIIGMTVSEKIIFFVSMIENITGIENYGAHLTNILQLDAVTKNEDRHFNNISFVEKSDGSFQPAPIFDNGAAFLSDKYSYGENLSCNELFDKMTEVQSKPFSMDFDEQLDACEQLYPSKILLNKNIQLDKDMLSHFYSNEDILKIEILLRESQRKYGDIYFNNKNNELELKEDI